MPATASGVALVEVSFLSIRVTSKLRNFAVTTATLAGMMILTAV